jgi:glutamate-5-semialdehyde dehydrogenase
LLLEGLIGGNMLEDMGKRAKIAARKLAQTDSAARNELINTIAAALWDSRAAVLAANNLDVEAGKKAGLTPALLDRLTLNEARLSGIVADLRTVASLADPVGEVFESKTLPNGLQVHKQRVPLGVLAVIYEARPNVTVDISGLSLKSGNSVILRGGSETINSNRAIVNVIRQSLETCGFPVDAVQFIDDPSRERVSELLKLHDYVDMVIPRGGAALHKYCRENSLIPVITGGIGICHLYVDESADLQASLPVIRNAKIQRPSVCNALDTVLVNRKIAAQFLPELVDVLAKDGVTFRADQPALALLKDKQPGLVQPAGPDDFDTEWLSLILGIKVVDGLDEAIAHIIEHSTNHSDGILTQNEANASRFIAEVDSATVYVNASTRFTDGGQLGLGAEVAVSTQRLHARGPMGLRELTTYKWVIQGNYHIRP